MKSTIINPVFKDTITFLSNDEMAGSASHHLLTLRPGGCNKPHLHRSFEETFTVLKGILGLQIKSKRKQLLPGEQYTVQRNEWHYFFNATQEEICFKVSLRRRIRGWNMRCVYYTD